jgi:lipoprotein-anchoring transpeptidase ErfK/SrfK
MSLHTVSGRKQHAKNSMLIGSVALLLLLLLSACGTPPQMQQQASQNKAQLDRALKNAHNVGVPNTMLQSVNAQEQQLAKANAPLALFSDTTTTDYYTKLATRYHLLTQQVQGLQTQATQQFKHQASSNVQRFGSLLAQCQSQGFSSAKNFTHTLVQNQNALARAKYPKEFLAISQSALTASAALNLMDPTHKKLSEYQSVIQQLKTSKLDTSALDQQYSNDTQLFQRATTTQDFQNIMNQVNVQLVETTSLSTQAIPYVGQAKLNELSTDLALMKQYGVSTKDYQQHLTTDRTAFTQAKTIQAFLKASSQVDKDTTAIQFPLLKAKVNYALQQYHQMVKHWGDTHQFHDSYNGVTYRMGYEYDQAGTGSDLDNAVQSAVTESDYQSALDFINTTTTDLKAMETNHNDHTPWSKPHATDLQLMRNYGAMKGGTIVVSLAEQALRYYVNGKLVRSFLITSGQYDKPSVPGFWQIVNRESPTVFKSDEPKSSPFWYPDTPINFAMEYRNDGYYLHDSWWRADYGPGTQFPHYDSGGDESFAGIGSHGCVNMPEDQASWLYNNTSYSTVAILY